MKKFTKEKKEVNKYFNLSECLDSVIVSGKNLKEELANFLDGNRQSTKIIEEVINRVHITLELKGDDKFKVQIQIFPEEEVKEIS